MQHAGRWPNCRNARDLAAAKHVSAAIHINIAAIRAAGVDMGGDRGCAAGGRIEIDVEHAAIAEKLHFPAIAFRHIDARTAQTAAQRFGAVPDEIILLHRTYDGRRRDSWARRARTAALWRAAFRDAAAGRAGAFTASARNGRACAGCNRQR